MKENLSNSNFSELWLPLLATILSLLACTLFLRLYLTQTSQQFADDFSKQNMDALATSDSYQLATRLNSISSSVHWVCLSAKRGLTTYFNKAKSSDCGERYLQTVVTIPAVSKEGLEISFTLTLPPALKWGGASFFLMQLFLLLTLFYAGRKAALRTERARQEGKIMFADLAAQAAHDIRSPLSAMNMLCSQLSSIGEAEQQILKSVTTRINSIADELINKSKLKPAKKNEFPQIRHNINSETESISLMKTVKAAASEKLLEIKYDDRTSIDIRDNLNGVSDNVIFPRNKLERIISNVINNSIEAYAGDGRIILEISRTGQLLQLSVTDFGVGIRSDILEKIGKDNFTSGKTEGPSGSGIGLKSAFDTVRAHGGRIELQSKLGVGTTVTISLIAAS